MTTQFNRVYDLTIIPESGEARIIRELRVEFEIIKSTIGFPNTARIVIYNPNPATISALQKEFTKIVFNAGYVGNSKLLFKGQVKNTFPSVSDVDRLLTVYAGDGQMDWQNSFFNKTFTENVAVNTAILEVIDSFENTDKGTLDGLPDVKDKLRGQTLSGSSKDILDDFAKEYGFTWSIQDGEIVTTALNTPIQGTQAVLITAATGMLESPTITDLGVEVKTLLNPQLLPNTAFKIESVNTEVQLGNLFFEKIRQTNATGIYKTQEVIFRGDSELGEWSSAVKGVRIDV